ncbi:MAG: PSD1 domain-containing protein [Planctomycetaceae bacterium]|nr:PSD1 domain-containing protein [Planctomycetaceae bacterium]
MTSPPDFATVVRSILLTLMLSGSRLAWSADTTEQDQFFETQIRPLLVKRCVGCHGAKKQEAGLRLDTKAGVTAGVDGEQVILAGKPEESRLLQVLQYSADDVQMPPSGKLPNDEVALLTQWIAAGAHWPDEPEHAGGEQPRYAVLENGEINFEQAAASHWAYQPIRMPSPPPVSIGSPSASPIDRFLLARLDEQGLTFSNRADRRTLIRRAHFDLIGLPPTYEEVQLFINDESPDAYTRLIERLLASPLYGQRWGRHWLDIARYADTKGYVFTQNRKYPYAYTYRNFVIEAFNDDKSIDQFIVEQLAADHLELNDDDPTLAALGFLTVGPRFLNREPDIIDDRIDVVTRGLMGMTVACSRCHDHKYDPIPTADYYSLYGVFASSQEPGELPVIGEIEHSPAYQAYLDELHKREQAVEDYKINQHAELLKRAREHASDYLLAVLEQQKLIPAGIDVKYEHGPPRKKLVELWESFLKQQMAQNDPVWTPWQHLSAISAESFATDAQTYLTSAETESIQPLVRQALVDAAPQSIVDVAQTYRRLLIEIDKEWQDLLAMQLEQPPTALADADREQLRRALYGPQSLTDVPFEQHGRLFETDQSNKITDLERKIPEWQAESPGAPPRAMVMQDKGKPVEPVIFLRGTPGRNGPKVPRRFPRIVAGNDAAAFSQGSGRLELAQQIVSPNNPLTARVFINRVWMQHFGSPLVSTPSDFGTRSDPPTHPELLDWLAASFIEHGWSLKWLHREIMLSAAFQQASIDRPAARSADPENRLLWRMNRRRLDFEPMRDSLLFVAGRLDPSLNSRSVDIEASPDAGQRTVYTFIDRNNFSGLLRTFDYPSPDATSPQRPNTTVPQQSLYEMNAPFVQKMAESVIARPDVQSMSSPDEQVTAMFRVILGRDPSEDERRLALDLLSTGDGQLIKLSHALLMTNEFLFVD